MSFTPGPDTSPGTWTCDRCGADCGDGAIPSECSSMVVADATAADGRAVKNFCPPCTGDVLAWVATYTPPAP